MMIDAPLQSGQADVNQLSTGFDPSCFAETFAHDFAALPTTIDDLTANSREARRGMAFLAYPGAVRDGRDFIADAMTRGASAVFWDADNFQWNSEWRVPNLPIANLKSHASAIAGQVFNHPSQKLNMIGVTGTNGKTSVSHWIAQSLEHIQQHAAVIGTIGNGLIGALQASENTTPDAVVLQRTLRDFVAAGATSCAMEVSSHGLQQGRVADIKFDIAVFTNLTRDHLDYHGTMAAYGEAKAALFNAQGLHTAVINVDDHFGCELAARTIRRGIKVIRYSAQPPFNGNRQAEIRASDIALSSAGMNFRISGLYGQADVETDILGAFNVSNLLAVMGALLASGHSLKTAVQAINRLQPVPGRMQKVRLTGKNGHASKPLVVVDYAHTPDALEKALNTVSAIVNDRGRLICVFGCGGDRDKGKRAQMGTIAAKLADFSVVTSDNPRREEAQNIIRDIEQGMVGAPYHAVPDRYTAIYEALNLAKTGDVVLIAGKGHEDYQIVGEEKLHFSDVEVAQEALAAWQGSSK